MKKQDRTYRVVAFLNRQELDFLDDLAKDIYFTYGINISRQKLIEEIIAAIKDGDIKGKQELIERMLNLRNKQTEKRKYPRLKKNLSVRYRAIESLSGQEASTTEDLSINGMRIGVSSKENAPEVGQIMEIMISDPKAQEEPIKVVGKVAWVKKNQAGIKLTYIKKEDIPRFLGYSNQDVDSELRFKVKG